MTNKKFIQHKGFNVFIGAHRVSAKRIEAAKAELAAAAAPKSSPKSKKAKAEATSTAAEG